MRKWISLLLVLFLLSVPAASADSVITTSGTGESSVPADNAVISLGVSARDDDVLEAQAKVNEAIASIRTALISSGIAEKDINTDYINIYAMYDYREGTEALAAYNANSTLAIRVTEMEAVGEVIDTAFGAGANTLNGISFSASDTLEAKEAALRAAVEDARAKAEILAEAAGLSITGIEAIQEGGTYSYDRGAGNNFAFDAAEKQSAAGTVVQAARLTVSASISITFTVEEQSESAGENS